LFWFTFFNNLSLVQHSHARGDAKGALHFVRHNDRGRLRFLSEADNQFVTTVAMTGSRPAKARPAGSIRAQHEPARKGHAFAHTAAEFVRQQVFVSSIPTRSSFSSTILSISLRDLSVSSSSGSATFSRTVSELNSANIDKPSDVLSHLLKFSALQTVDLKLFEKNRAGIRSKYAKDQAQNCAFAAAALAP
jgi:hypothetical protein